ncbi:MAG TPA: mannosyltransferase family protein [Micromonosporaceae bacterium]
MSAQVEQASDSTAVSAPRLTGRGGLVDQAPGAGTRATRPWIDIDRAPNRRSLAVARPQPWRRAWWAGLATWAGAATAYFIVNALSGVIDDRPGPAWSEMIRSWYKWDAGHYVLIAQGGYPEGRLDSPAFFPLYPLVIHGADRILPGDAVTAAVVVSNVACVAALVMLHRFAEAELGERLAGRVLLYLIAWPGAFFLCAGYNESLFLLFCLASLYLMRRGRWWYAGALGGLASATRLAGVLLVVAFLIEYARQDGWRPRGWRPWRWRPVGWRLADLRRDTLAVLLVPSGLVGYATYCWFRFGDPLAFSHAQAQWGRHLAPPWASLADATSRVFTGGSLHNLFDVITYAAVIALLILAMAGRWRLRADQAYLTWYAVTALLVLLSGPVGGLFPLQGSMRYSLELVPVFFMLAKLGEHRHFDRLYLLPAVAAQVVFLLTFFNGVFIA